MLQIWFCVCKINKGFLWLSQSTTQKVYHIQIEIWWRKKNFLCGQPQFDWRGWDARDGHRGVGPQRDFSVNRDFARSTAASRPGQVPTDEYTSSLDRVWKGNQSFLFSQNILNNCYHISLCSREGFQFWVVFNGLLSTWVCICREVIGQAGGECPSQQRFSQSDLARLIRSSSCTSVLYMEEPSL